MSLRPPESGISQQPTLYQEYPEFPKANPPIAGNWDGAHTSIGAGVAIFHLASGRVVLCYHTVRQSYFLPKGRRDANEDSGPGAEREGFEEVSILHKWDLNTMRTALNVRNSQATATAFSLSPYPITNPKRTIHLRPTQRLRPSSPSPSGPNWFQPRT